ncbi:MAG: ligase-associated DNA damage response DEXH box helicase [Bacteroidota bacterium]|nr:ligase-associated DNA damage response DEXH box helicase [Bacteroidota bacterium]
MERPPKHVNISGSGAAFFEDRGWAPFPFQSETWDHFASGGDGLVNAPTGSGKTYSCLVPATVHGGTAGGLRVLWITPIRALAKEIHGSASRLLDFLDNGWTVEVRTGDTPSAQKQKQDRHMPEILITTPESLHVLLAKKGGEKRFGGLSAIVVDEWHDLLGNKRGVQVELAIAQLKALSPSMRVWGISATIGNLDEAMETLVGLDRLKDARIIRSAIEKRIVVDSLMPEAFEKLPWSGHLGVQLLDQVVDIIRGHASTLVFTNTRSQSEIWYQKILAANPDLAGAIALHHGSISKELRFWVEDALYDGRLKAVVCTSSLDLGVDFRPVEAIVQIGGPKGVARFVQRAGRSGHQPGAESKIHFLPTFGLELLEAAALRKAVETGEIEPRRPMIRSFDVLVQFLCTLAIGDGFRAEALRERILTTHAFATMDEQEWGDVLAMVTTGGRAFAAYDEFNRVEKGEDGVYRIVDRRAARRHRMSIGTIVGDTMIAVKWRSGGLVGHVEEYFVSSLNPGDVFWFGGRCLELIRFKNLVAQVKPAKSPKGRIPTWQGGRLPWTSMVSRILRETLDDYAHGRRISPELERLTPMLELQSERSHLPVSGQVLMEVMESREGHHLFVFPMEGRMVHEGVAALMAYRMSLLRPMTFSMAYNDYGFELLSDQPIPITEAFDSDLFSTAHLMDDLEATVNGAELARRQFRDIAVIAGLVFRGYPGQPVKDRHLQGSSSLLFDVLADHDPVNLLYRQAFDEMTHHQIEFDRLREVLDRLNAGKWVITHPERPTPFSFPILVDRLREKLSSEQLEARIKRMARATG